MKKIYSDYHSIRPIEGYKILSAHTVGKKVEVVYEKICSFFDALELEKLGAKKTKVKIPVIEYLAGDSRHTRMQVIKGKLFILNNIKFIWTGKTLLHCTTGITVDNSLGLTESLEKLMNNIHIVPNRVSLLMHKNYVCPATYL